MPIVDVINVIHVHHAGYKYVLLFKKENVDVAINDATFSFLNIDDEFMFLRRNVCYCVFQ